MKLKINHLQHIGIPVTDLSRSIAFYRRLGFEPVMESEFDYEGDRGQVAMLQLDAIVLEIYQFPDKELEAIRNRENGHIDHIAFDVSDVEATFQELKAAGFYIFEEAPVYLPFWKNGCKYFNIAGPDGERLEFNQIL